MIAMTAVMGKLGTDVRLFARQEIPAGTPWQLDPWTGELLIQGPDGEWTPPTGDDEHLTLAQLACCAANCERDAKEWGRRYAEAYMDPPDEEEWEGASTFETFEEFSQALANANAPEFFGAADQAVMREQVLKDVDLEDGIEFYSWATIATRPDGWLGSIAYEAAEQRAWGILCQERERAATLDIPTE